MAVNVGSSSKHELEMFSPLHPHSLPLSLIISMSIGSSSAIKKILE